MTTLDDVRHLLADEHGLAVVSTARTDGSVLSSVVNAGVMPHPITGEPVVCFVSAGSAARLAHLRRGAPLTLTVRRGWQWTGVCGRTDLIGPDDPVADVDPDRLRALHREVFTAAGGTHGDWDEFDRVMASERRVVVLVHPERITGNT